MNEVLRSLDFCYVYIDDILIFSEDHDQRLEHLQQVFDRLQEYGLLINESKYSFGKSEVRFLGYVVAEGSTRPIDDKVQAMLPHHIRQSTVYGDS